MEKRYRFYKELDNKWYVYLPEWTGEKEDLEMVMGADTMLDIIGQYEDTVYLTLSTEPFDGYNYLLTFKELIYEGCTYNLTSVNFNIEFEVWLCAVTKFVFGDFPEKIYIRNNG